tara:strand:- start:4126 stop:4356 length:231 start_codon:yes stop_codon:yes gene_type:complete
MDSVKFISEQGKDTPTEDSFPGIPKALLEKLEEIYPDSCPKLGMKKPEIFFRSGQRAVVDYLRARYEEQVQKARGE